MNANRYLMIMTLGLALVCMTAGVFGAEDISSLLESRGPAAREIVTEPSIVRESKLSNLPINSEKIEFLIDNPQVVLALAHLYAPFLDSYRVEVRPDHVVHIEEPGILAGDAELIDVRPGRRVYLIAGYYDIFKMRFDGDVVLVTMYAEQRASEAVSVDASTIAYFKIHGGFSGTLARLADFLFPKKVDERIERLVRAAESIGVAVNKDPAEAYGKLKSAGEVSAEKLEEFGRVFLP